jgi:hypothetical protein
MGYGASVNNDAKHSADLGAESPLCPQVPSWKFGTRIIDDQP